MRGTRGLGPGAERRGRGVCHLGAQRNVLLALGGRRAAPRNAQDSRPHDRPALESPGLINNSIPVLESAYFTSLPQLLNGVLYQTV